MVLIRCECQVSVLAMSSKLLSLYSLDSFGAERSNERIITVLGLFEIFHILIYDCARVLLFYRSNYRRSQSVSSDDISQPTVRRVFCI
jgi:hypothetical protein